LFFIPNLGLLERRTRARSRSAEFPQEQRGKDSKVEQGGSQLARQCGA